MKEPISEVFNIDCIEYMRGVQDKFFDLAVVDPPYGIKVAEMGFVKNPTTQVKQKNGISLNVKKSLYKSKKWDSYIPVQNYFDELFRVSKNQIIWGVNYFNNISFTSGRIVWDKYNGSNSFSDAEIAFCSMHNTTRIFRYMWSGMFQGKSIKEGRIQQGDKRLNEKRMHPTQKPIALYLWLLQNYTKQGDKIFDSHMGSQSSRIAAYQLGFDYYGCEILLKQKI